MGSGEAKRFREMYGSAGRHGSSFWEEEKNNIGVKLLKGMGWTTGQGLGKDGRGRTDAVKQLRKKENAGIGSKAGTRDEAFKASQELFNDVLSRLSGEADGGDGAVGGTEAKLGSAATSVRGVLARRQMTRRFCRSQSGDGGSVAAVGGMASANMSATNAMNEIFGRKTTGDGKSGNADADCADSDATAERDPGLQQTTSKVSVSDYFARRRAQLGLAQTMAGTSGTGGSGSSGFTLEDQASFAEAQVAMAYGGRRGLGLGAVDEPPDRQRSAPGSCVDTMHCAKRASGMVVAAGASGDVAAAPPIGEGNQTAKAEAEAKAKAKAERKAERKAQRKAERKAERKAAKKAAKKAEKQAEKQAADAAPSNKRKKHACDDSAPSKKRKKPDQDP